MRDPKYYFLCLVLITACSTPRPVVQQPQPPPETVDATAELAMQNVNALLYQNASAEVAWLYEQGYAFARVKLDRNLERATDTLPPAVVVDVDETVLDNSPYELENILAGRTYTDSTWKVWTSKARAKALPGARGFLEYAVSRGCEIFYITNRDDVEKEATIANLRSEGFPMADSAHVFTMEGSSDKSERRARVRATHDIVLYVGDQLTDFDQSLKMRNLEMGIPAMYELEGPLSEYFILLPNAVYGYWRDGITGRGSPEEKMKQVEQFMRQRIR